MAVGGLQGQAWGAQDCLHPHSPWLLVLGLPLALPPWLGSEWAVSQAGPGARSEGCGLGTVPTPLEAPVFPHER